MAEGEMQMSEDVGIVQALIEVRAARREVEQAKTAEAAAKKALEETSLYQQWDWARTARQKAEEVLAGREQLVRDLGRERYEKEGAAMKVPGISVKLYHVARYKLEEALAWARENMAGFLILDTKRFEKAAIGGVLPPGAPVQVVQEPRVSIASDLDTILS
jgi:hypothetical protein